MLVSSSNAVPVREFRVESGAYERHGFITLPDPGYLLPLVLMARIYISIGSNIDAETHLRQAVTALRERYGTLVLSSVYESEAVGFTGDNFLNMVVGLDTDENVETVVSSLRAIEDRYGRERCVFQPGPSIWICCSTMMSYGMSRDWICRVARLPAMRLFSGPWQKLHHNGCTRSGARRWRSCGSTMTRRARSCGRHHSTFPESPYRYDNYLFCLPCTRFGSAV
jgi:hypothetical protein